MKMNSVIQEKRRTLGMTQEQVAEYMGVSTPAVSKWETGQTCPDTVLLPRLARLLKTDLNTLFCFREDLSAEEIQTICATIRKAENPDTAFRLAKQYHQEYPHCEELTLSLSYVLEAVTNNSSLSPEDHQKYQEQINTVLTELTHSHRTSISNAASFLLANKYIRTGDLQQAQHILDQMPDPEDATQELTDKLFLQVTIYQQQGKFAEAAEKLEYALLNAATRIQTLLSLYTSLTMTAGETEIAKAIADKGTSFAQLFQLWEYNAHVNSYTVALKEKDTAAVLNLMRKLLNALCHPWATDETLLFSHVDWAISPGQQKDVLHNLLGSLSRDEEYAFLRGEPEFTALLEEFRS